jgi:glycolate oxidase FAD binding subunit
MMAELAALVPRATVDGRPQTDIAGVAPAVRVTPTTVRELEDIVGWASKRRMAMAALGGGTTLGVGNPPSRLDLVIDTGRLNSVVDYDAEDLVLTAQAGTTVHQLRSMVRRDSLVMPLDPRSSDRATLGGVIACADHGPKRRQYGGLRDLVLGLKVVLPDGGLANFGGRVLKNVAGYDVGKLFIGSIGTIGIIAEATVRLLPSAAREELLLVPVAGLEEGRRLVTKILESVLIPSALEFLSPGCVGLLGLDRRIASPESPYLLLIALEGHSAAVEREVRDISALCAEVSPGLEARRASEIGLAPDDCWASFGGIRARARGEGFPLGLRATAPLARVWDVATAVEEYSRANGIASAYTMSCGTGYLEVYAAGSAADLRTYAQAVRSRAEALEGAVTVLDGWSELGREFDAWGARRTDYALIQTVKRKYDPEGLMNPGRFVGGL